MKKLKLIVFITSFVLMYGCQKEKDTPTPSETTPPPTSTCPTGYTGTNCVIQITPSSIRINKIKVTKFPQYNSGNNWDGCCDIGDYKPDLYITLKNSSSVLLSTGYFQDSDYYQTYEFNSGNTSSLPYYISDVSSLLTISVYDKENIVSDELIGGYNFFLYSNTNGFPTVMTLGAGGNITFEFQVTYIF